MYSLVDFEFILNNLIWNEYLYFNDDTSFTYKYALFCKLFQASQIEDILFYFVKQHCIMLTNHHIGRLASVCYTFELIRERKNMFPRSYWSANWTYTVKKRVKYLISEMFIIPFIIGALFFQNILAGTVLLKMTYGKNHLFLFFFHCYMYVFLSGDYSNLPGEISKDVSAQFLNRNRHGDSRCDTDQKYCESHRVRCMVRYSINCLDA